MGTQNIKTKKNLLFTLLPLTCFGIIEMFMLPFFRAYSRETNNSNSKIDNSKCYQKYQVHPVPKVPPEKRVYPYAEAYCDAVVNSKIVTDEKIWRNLTPIVGYNEKLEWENGKVNSRVLVTTWKNPKRYKKGEITTAHREIWVTVVPELKTFCQKYHKNKSTQIKLPHRINQVLGLPPETQENYKKRRLVEIWVEPKDLFRSTPNPEITDNEAELDFPQPYSLVSISYEYKHWFLNQLMTNDNPWTRLGYTYDWGNEGDWHWRKIDPERPANAGLSEFIIREDAPIKIKSIHEAEDYCK